MGAWQAAALASQFGFAVIGSLVGGVVLGQVIDRWLGTAPAFFLIGLLLGLVLSVYLIYAIYRVQLQPRRSRRRAPAPPGAAPAPASHRSPRNPPPSE